MITNAVTSSYVPMFQIICIHQMVLQPQYNHPNVSFANSNDYSILFHFGLVVWCDQWNRVEFTCILRHRYFVMNVIIQKNANNSAPPNTDTNETRLERMFLICPLWNFIHASALNFCGHLRWPLSKHLLRAAYFCDHFPIDTRFVRREAWKFFG